MNKYKMMNLFRIISLILIIQGLNNCCFAQSYNYRLLIPYRENKLWGYCDTLGNIKIKPAYDSVTFFTEYADVSKVFVNKKESIIDTEGKLLLPFFDLIWRWNNGIYIVTDNNRKGIYNSKGNPVVPVIYEKFTYTYNYKLYENEENKIIGIKDDHYFLIDYTNNEIKEINDPSDAVQIVVLMPVMDEVGANKTTFNSKAPAWISKIVDSVQVKFELDSAKVIVHKSWYNGNVNNFKYYKIYKNNSVGIWSKDFIIMPKYDEIKSIFEENTKQIIVEKNKKFGVINEKSEAIIAIKYDTIARINENLFITTKAKKQGAIFLNSSYKNIENKYGYLSYYTALFVNKNWTFFIFNANVKGKRGYVGENGIEYFKD